MSISIYLTPMENGAELVMQLMQDEFGINADNAQLLYDYYVRKHFENLKDTLYILAETDYIDKVYRDTYYRYYSSKLKNYQRNCIRFSFFEGEVCDADFQEKEKLSELQEIYRGFLIIRPTEPFIIGRSVISPKALKSSNLFCCTTPFQTTANGIKLMVEGFPHSSQDTETTSCAETSLWAIMEYFSSKYTDYSPVLPSKIIQTLSKVAVERQLPSKGLTMEQMSFALKEFGFGTRIYRKEVYPEEFDSLVSCYIESGIPIILAIESRDNGGGIGHALLVIGHKSISHKKIDEIDPYVIFDKTLQEKAKERNIVIYDYHSIKKEFIFIDDNQPAYQSATLDSPAAHYPENWHGCKAIEFIAPLYTKIYLEALEAFEAKRFIITFLTMGTRPLNVNSEILLRFYLASSRSYKNEAATNITIHKELKRVILETSMPKFIWVAEISTKDLIKENMANGLVIVDATEATVDFDKPLIFAALQGSLVTFNEKSRKFENDLLNLPNFLTYKRNLNSFEI